MAYSSLPLNNPPKLEPQAYPDRRVSARCLIKTVPKAYPRATSSPNGGSQPPRSTPLTYRQQAARALHAAYAYAVLVANEPGGPWAFPTQAALVAALEQAMFDAVTTRGATLGAIAQSLGISLVSGIFDLPLGEGETVTQIFPQHAQYRIGARRLHITHGMLRAPTGNPVLGPYIGTLAVDSKKEIVRAMLHPVWCEDDAVGLPRSEVERQILQHAKSNGTVAFTPTHRSQYGMWQQAFGSRWRGDLTQLPFVADLVSPPTNPCDLISIVEVFGVQRIRKYDERTKTKRRIGAELEANGALRFLPHKVQWGAHRKISIAEAASHLGWAADDGREAMSAGLFVPWAAEQTV